MVEQRQAAIYREGKAAYLAGVARNEGPYYRNFDDWWWWQLGWDAARDDAAQKKAA